MSSSVPAVFASVLAAGVWPLVIHVLAVVTVAVVALARADKRDVPAVFGAFAQGFGFHKRIDERDKQRNTGQVAVTDETEQRDEEA